MKVVLSGPVEVNIWHLKGEMKLFPFGKIVAGD
jgi:hypothetical protein